MKKTPRHSGFAIALTLVLMALIAIIVVAYLSSTRIERSTAAVHANRLRAKITADSGLSAAIHLLRENTRYGNYITAMPPPSPSPVPYYTEVYRPVDPADPIRAAKENDFLKLSNAAGEALISLAAPTPSSSPLPAVDPRPTPEIISTPLPANSPFALSTPSPALTNANGYDFNQIVRIGSSNGGRLVDPSGRSAFGQWVSVRDTKGEQIGRYAFFIEDESMKVNVNVSGNSLATPSPTASPHLRVNDMAPIPAITPTTQTQEIDPTALLPLADRSSAITSLTTLGATGQRLSTKLTTALLSNWMPIDNYAHLLTTLSRDDNATSRGWQRLDLNTLIAGATTNASKVAVATRIANWIRDAWTGPTALAAFQQDADGRQYQLYNDERLRLQIAANIVDYIDTDKVPTDVSDIIPAVDLAAIPVLGIEKLPYLSGVMVIYQAKDRAIAVPPTSPATKTAKMSMKFRFNFLNLFGESLELNEVIQRIEVKGVPVVWKVADPAVFDKHTAVYSIPVANLTPLTGTGFTIQPGTNGDSTSGVRSFESNWVVEDETVTFRSATGNPIFSPADQMTVSVLGPSDARLDVTAMTWNTDPTGFRQGGTTTPGSTSAGDFLLDSPTAVPGVARQIAAIFLMESTVPSGAGTLTRQFGDPRFRPALLNERWRRRNRTDTESAFTSSELASTKDILDLQNRTAGFDWYDKTSNRPLSFIRNAPMVNIGELGNISAVEYPWRSLYIQHPDRPSNSSSAIVVDEVATKRRRNALDWVLLDLFRTSADVTRSGDININSTLDAAGVHRAIDPLFLNIPVGNPAPLPTPQTLDDTKVGRLTIATGSSLVSIIPERRKSNGLSPPDNTPPRPYFQIGELASDLSRLFSSSTLDPTEASQSTVVYSVLRSAPANTAEVNANYRSDMNVEQPFREVSNSITTHGNVFRILYVGQTLKNGITQAEYLGESYLERQAVFAAEGSNPDAMKTSDSKYKVLWSRVITE